MQCLFCWFLCYILYILSILVVIKSSTNIHLLGPKFCFFTAHTLYFYVVVFRVNRISICKASCSYQIVTCHFFQKLCMFCCSSQFALICMLSFFVNMIMMASDPQYVSLSPVAMFLQWKPVPESRRLWFIRPFRAYSLVDPMQVHLVPLGWLCPAFMTTGAFQEVNCMRVDCLDLLNGIAKQYGTRALHCTVFHLVTARISDGSCCNSIFTFCINFLW